MKTTQVSRRKWSLRANCVACCLSTAAACVDVIALLDPQVATRRKSAPLAAAEKVTRRARVLKFYKNPHSGETVEAKGGITRR